MSQGWTPGRDMPSLQGKVAFVTGGNSGIGLHTIKHLAAHGAKVYFTARSKAKADHTIDTIIAEVPTISKDHVVWIELELSDIPSILKAVEAITAREEKLHILVNNAAICLKNPDFTEHGWERHMAVNHFGHFVLTNGLSPLLRRAAQDEDADVRVVVVTSKIIQLIIPQNYPLDFSNHSLFYGKWPYEPVGWRWFSKWLFTRNMLPYSFSKLFDIMFTRQLQAVFDTQKIPIIAMSVHPGAVTTSGAEGLYTYLFNKLFVNFVEISEDEGSFTTLWAATATEVKENPSTFKGKYAEPVGQLVDAHPAVEEQQQLEGLWEVTTKEINSYLTQHNLGILPEW